MVCFKGRYFGKEMILQSVRWTNAYSMRHRDIKAMVKKWELRSTTVQSTAG
ncbi:hypothetical protein MNBD_GAMMA12-879 [hydrothermal vent metagenome]|uniref:Uncharacterized protein n=1 Tax=hydrothermal vent metagenome TaxID=652676 RepID=A0A3B0YXR9_9ZZZZ